MADHQAKRVMIERLVDPLNHGRGDRIGRPGPDPEAQGAPCHSEGRRFGAAGLTDNRATARRPRHQLPPLQFFEYGLNDDTTDAELFGKLSFAGEPTPGAVLAEANTFFEY